MPVCLIDVPFAMGDDRHEGSAGGRRLIEGGGRDVFYERGVGCRDVRVARWALHILGHLADHYAARR